MIPIFDIFPGQSTNQQSYLKLAPHIWNSCLLTLLVNLKICFIGLKHLMRTISSMLSNVFTKPVPETWFDQNPKLYAANGILPGLNLILTCETKAKPLSTETVERTISNYFL